MTDEMSIPDRTVKFYADSSIILSYLNGRPIRVITPFDSMDKTSMVEWYITTGFDVESLLKTVGCYSDVEGHCGDCGACLRRYVAFRNNGIHPEYELTDRIKKEYLHKLSDYSYVRQERMLQWL